MDNVRFGLAVAFPGRLRLRGVDPCANVRCGSVGTCVEEDGAARCECPAGYQASGTECVRELPKASTLATALESPPNHQNYLNLRTMTVENNSTDYDLRAFEDPAAGGMALALGPGVAEVNLGSLRSFHEVERAPADGYQTDAPAQNNYVIGNGFATGGNYEQGYTMSWKVYVLKLSDGTYAKLQVQSALRGVMQIWAFRQAAGGDDIATRP